MEVHKVSELWECTSPEHLSHKISDSYKAAVDFDCGVITVSSVQYLRPSERP